MERAEGCARWFGAGLGIAVLAMVLFFGLIMYLTTCQGQHRWNPAFQGFHGYWDRDRDVEQGGEHWRLDLSHNHSWFISTYRNDESVVIDSGTWSEIGERTYRLDSKNGSRTAVLSKHDEWVMEIDGVKYFRVVK